jgi:hypothetical protein
MTHQKQANRGEPIGLSSGGHLAGRGGADAAALRPAPSVCIVIPVVPPSRRATGCEEVSAALEETLVSVLENRPDQCEIVVVLGCEYADPWNIREEVVFLRAPEGSSLTACSNLGICSSRASVVHVLQPGWRATPGWVDTARAHFQNPDVGAVVPVLVSEMDRSEVLSAGIRVLPGGRRIECRPAKKRRNGEAAAEGPPLAAGFWRAEVFAIDGPGFSSACGDRMADADMAVTMAAAGWECVVEPASRVVAPVRTPERMGGFLAGLHAERLFWRARAGQPLLLPLLAHLFEVVRHAVAVAPWETAAVLFGRLLALTQFGSYVSRSRRLHRVRGAVAERHRDGPLALDPPAILRLDPPHAGPAAPVAWRQPDRRPQTQGERYRKSA